MAGTSARRNREAAHGWTDQRTATADRLDAIPPIRLASTGLHRSGLRVAHGSSSAGSARKCGPADRPGRVRWRNPWCDPSLPQREGAAMTSIWIVVVLFFEPGAAAPSSMTTLY